MSQLVLIANPGSASRKYAVFDGTTERARLHFEWIDGAVHYTLTTPNTSITQKSDAIHLDDVAAAVPTILHMHHILDTDEVLSFIGLRVVAPGGYFLHDHVVDDTFIMQLQAAQEQAPLHVKATLDEVTILRRFFPHATLYGISDSAFHSTKPDHAWNYGISLELADRLDIKRFGYHGLSVASVIKQISLPTKTIVCHLGGGASITAVHDGKSIDTTMGYSPLDGVIMNTRSGSLDIGAANRLKKELQLDDPAFERYLNTESGLRGLGGSSDIRQLLKQETSGDHRAHLALATYVYNLQKAIGQMAAAIDGVDAIVFTGTVGERSSVIRQRVAARFGYLGFYIDHTANTATNDPQKPTAIHTLPSKPIHVIPAQEESEITNRLLAVASLQNE